MTLPAAAEVTLPNGYWHEDVCLRQARVKAFGEGDAALDENLAAAALPIERVSALLARCVTHLGGRPCESAEQVRNLALGDREALLLQIRRLTFGDSIACTLECPSCSSAMDFQLQANQLILPGAERPSQYHEERVLSDETQWRVRFRMPRASDVEAALQNFGTTQDAALALLRSCIAWVRKEDEQGGEDNVPAEHWPQELAAQISTRMAELDPQAEITLQLECPSCGHEFSSLFDIADYFFRELSARERQLFYDVHRLALAYHWSETEILSMTPHKRKLYLELIDGGSAGE